MEFDEEYWTARYINHATQWDVGDITTPIKEYVDQLSDKTIKILIPGCGNAHEAAYLHKQGFVNVFIIDISTIPLVNFAKQYPTFPADHIINMDFFQLNDQFDLIIEQTFFCSLPPTERPNYISQMHKLLKDKGHLVGLLFDTTFDHDGPPFGGNEKTYKKLFEPLFNFDVFERCYNSIVPRFGRELFIKLSKK
ncbi:MAG TPA: methyltransferase domain-containing protein [Fulvivirga sp.]|nr:methyltransferase domain-containing protein [Fulvivirga sp.]